MEVTASEGSVSMKPKKLVGSESLTEADAQKLRHGLKQAREGKTRPWTKVKNELGLGARGRKYL